MKLLITTLTMIFISFGANALSIEDLYKHCKRFQTNGFSLDNLSEVQQTGAIACSMYLRGLIDLGWKNCKSLRILKEEGLINPQAFEGLSKVTANKMNVKINALIASFNNYAENYSENWSYSPTEFSHAFLSDKFPCKLDK